MEEINKLKKQLFSDFKKKDLSVVKKIFGIRISKDKKKGDLQLS